MYVFSTTTNLEDLAFMNSPENLIELSLADHIRAHELLFEIYGNPLWCNSTFKLFQERQKHGLGAQASHAVQEKTQQQFWNSDFQIEMARRSMGRPDARQIRSVGGKKGGITAKLNIAIQAHERFVFSYKNREIVCVMNCQTGTE